MPLPPSTSTKIAVSYSILNFQDPRFHSERMPVQSYVWDIMNPNTPEFALNPASPLCCLRFNPKAPETQVGGSYNGLISFFDIRKPSGSQPYEVRHAHPQLTHTHNHARVCMTAWSHEHAWCCNVY